MIKFKGLELKDSYIYLFFNQCKKREPNLRCPKIWVNVTSQKLVHVCSQYYLKKQVSQKLWPLNKYLF
jgi:hypothetical protein